MKLKSFLALALATLFLGCNSPTYLQDVTYQVSENLEVIRISARFADTVRVGIGATFPIDPYGAVFLNEYQSAQKPFEVGFFMNTASLNDSAYAQITPTELMPNGVPFPRHIGHALVQINAAQFVAQSEDFAIQRALSQTQVYGYFDVPRPNVVDPSWLGAAVVLDPQNGAVFPKYFMLEESYLEKSGGDPAIVIAVFGAGDQTSGGVAAFANVKRLLAQVKGREGQTISALAGE